MTRPTRLFSCEWKRMKGCLESSRVKLGEISERNNFSEVERAGEGRISSVRQCSSNTYLHAPSLLSDQLHWHDEPDLYFAGQITGVEEHVESTACAMLVSWLSVRDGRGAHRRLYRRQQRLVPVPASTWRWNSIKICTE